MKISIVTISFNEAKNIERTIKSVLEQSYKAIEYIVCDGGSTDGTAEVIAKYSNKLAYWVSERDGGIYFGMNKGLEKCTGDYVFFCNAGDALVDKDVVEKMVKTAEENGMPDLVYGDCMDILNGKHFIRTAHGPGFIQFGMPASHEAMMYKRSIISDNNLHYDTSYRIAADYKFTYQFVNKMRTSAHCAIPFVLFAEGGVSTANKWKGLSEACRVRREVGGLSFLRRTYIRLLQTAALLLSSYASPIYRMIRLHGK